MGSQINLPAIYIANIMGVLLCIGLLFGDSWKLNNSDKESRYLKYMVILTLITCVIDPLTFTADSKPGLICFLMVYGGNLWLVLSNALMGPLFLSTIITHMSGKILRKTKILIIALCAIDVVAVIINFFNPVFFRVDENNSYHRGDFFWLFMAIEIVFILIGATSYFAAKAQFGKMIFFPVIQFIVPIAIAIAIQAIFYGVSTIWPGIAISLCAILNSLKNESVYQDQLTGLYSRYYLDNIKSNLGSDRSMNVIAMMLDMNGFKQINDVYGHAEGDEALKVVARILKENIGRLGTVIRYAGDEFVIILNLQREDIAEGCVASIRSSMDKYNKSSGKEYKLSVSVGYCKLNLEEQSIDDLMNEVDRRMYKDKNRYYEINPKLDRRVSRK